MPNAYGFVGIPDHNIEQEIINRYGDNEQDLSYAQQVAQIAAEYTRDHPCQEGASKRSRREYRRAAKRAISAQAREKIKPVGFVGGFVFMAIISSIISFFVQLLLKNYYGEVDAKTMELEDLD